MTAARMQVWMTPAEWAEADLPGMPATRQGIDAMIRRENWAARGPQLARPRPGREGGGGWEYHLDNAPLSTRVAVAQRHLRIDDADTRPMLDERTDLSPRARQTRDAKLVLLRIADRFRREQHLSISAADSLISELFNSRSIELPAWVSATIEKVSPRSLARWRAIREANGDDALSHDPAVARKGTGQLERAADGRVKTFVLALIAKKPQIAAAEVKDTVADTFGHEIRVPPLRTIQQTLRVWREEYRNELQYLTDPDGYRSRTEYALTNSTRADRLNEIWQIDASPADVMLLGGRHSIYLAIDVYSRRTKVLVTKTPRAAGVGLLTRKCLLAWGVPERIKIDNGSDFAARATQRLFAALGIEVDFSRPYSPKEKGIVERAIGTFQRDLAGLPGFVGHSVADRKRIEGRKAFAARLGADPAELFDVDMDAAEFQAWCDDWSDKIYASTPHQGLGRRTPFEVAAGYAGPVRRIENEAALDILLAPVPGRDGLRTVTKTGLRIDGAHYYPDTVMPGAQVFCRMDPADLGRVLLFEPDGETYLGEAVCPELAGLDPVATIQRVKAAQKAALQDGIADIRREMRKIGPRAVADAMRREADRRACNLVAFPSRKVDHETSAIAAAAEAAVPAADRTLGLSGRAAEMHRELIAEQPAAIVTPMPETREARFRRALMLERRIEAGDAVEATEALWLGGYRQGSEYRAMQQMFEDFGPSAFGMTSNK